MQNNNDHICHTFPMHIAVGCARCALHCLALHLPAALRAGACLPTLDVQSCIQGGRCVGTVSVAAHRPLCACQLVHHSCCHIAAYCEMGPEAPFPSLREVISRTRCLRL